MKSIVNFLDVDGRDILKIYQFGSSVEGKKNPRDIDLFVIVKNGRYKFRKHSGLHMPFVFNEGKKQYFIMPESDGEDLLSAMLYTGRKDPDRQHKGIKIRIR